MTEHGPTPGMEEILEMEQNMLASGKSQREVDEWMEDLRRLGFEEANTFMRIDGVPEQEIQAFWREISGIGDASSLDAIDASDDNYEAGY